MLTPTEFRRAHNPLPPHLAANIVSISRRGGECIGHGIATTDSIQRNNLGSYLLERLTEAVPTPMPLWRAQILSQGVVLSRGHGVACRHVRLLRPAGFPSYEIDPKSGWCRIGFLARPAGRLPV
jgi:hypothetical protein